MSASIRKETASEGNENKAQPNLTHQEATAPRHANIKFIKGDALKKDGWTLISSRAKYSFNHLKQYIHGITSHNQRCTKAIFTRTIRQEQA